ncbi:WYL domain-containing protein [Streptomyces noursei]
MARLSLLRRETLIAAAADKWRPIDITYASKDPCPGTEHTNRRTIEVHDIKTTEDGNNLVIAYCRNCRQVEHFRLDRILSHRARRDRYQGPPTRVTPYFTKALGRPTERSLAQPYKKRYSSYGLLARIREKIADANAAKEAARTAPAALLATAPHHQDPGRPRMAAGRGRAADLATSGLFAATTLNLHR